MGNHEELTVIVSDPGIERGGAVVVKHVTSGQKSVVSEHECIHRDSKRTWYQSGHISTSSYLVPETMGAVNKARKVLVWAFTITLLTTKMDTESLAIVNNGAMEGNVDLNPVSNITTKRKHANHC